MPHGVNILGAAVGVHALAFALLGLCDLPDAHSRRPPLEMSVVVRPPPPPPPAGPTEKPAAAGPARRPAGARPRARVASVAPASARPATVAPPPAPPESPPPPPGSDEAVLLSAIGHAARNDAAIDGGIGNPDGSGEGARGADFLRGAARGALAPPHESRAAAAEPVEDYTRLIPEYTDEAIHHDVSASVAVQVEVDEDGRVVDAHVLQGAGYGLDEVAVKTVKKYRFRPARDSEGRPVRSTFGWRIVWDSHWRRLMLYDAYGHPACRGQAPLNLGSLHPVYIDCDEDGNPLLPGPFDLGANRSTAR